MKNNYLTNIVITLITITMLSGIALSSSNSSAASASTATAAVKIAASCTLTSTGGGNYSATVPNGTSAEIPGSTLSVSCNDAGGFALYAVGYSNDTIGNNNMIGQSTNIATNTSGTDSYWAMKINPTTGTTPTIENSFNNYHIVPNAHTKVASYSQSTGSGSLSVQTTYKASISTTQLAGNYLGQVKYTLVHPVNEEPAHEVACEAGKICYNANTNIVEGQMSNQRTTEQFLNASNFKRGGYGFAGWSDAYDYDTNPNAHFYGPNQNIKDISSIPANGLSLYAVWIPSSGTLQNWNGCSNLTQTPIDGTANLSNVIALTDERDDNTYAITKLADDKCWMIENLRLSDKNASNNYINLSSDNTNSPSLPLTNVYDTGSVSNHLSPTTSAAYDASSAPEGWCNDHTSASCIDQSRLNTDNTVLFINNAPPNYDATGNVYSYGNYYNWYSATAGHGVFGKRSGNVDGDICPAGWRLPTGYTDSSDRGEFYALNTIINSGDSFSTNKLRSYPVNFFYQGQYWSSTTDGSTSVRILSLENDSVDPLRNWFRNKKGFIRCIAGV